MIGLVLAAGAGRRMGGPKALLDWGGNSLLEAAMQAATTGGCREVFAVVRADVADALVALGRDRLIVSSEEDALGPAGSIAAFVRNGRMPERESIAIAPVDLVPAAWSALPELARALAERPDAVAARPVFQSRRGHPVLLRSQCIAEYATRSPRPLRDVLRDLGPALIDVSVDVHAVTADLDTPDDVTRWRALMVESPR